jgi:thiol-disulfide isomerase/thioredoxin
MNPRTLLIVLAACSGDAAPQAGKPRVDAVAAAKVEPRKIEGFCERHDGPEAAKPFVYPPMDTPAPGASPNWRWINVWATWCGPCIAEMPSLLKWSEKLAAAGQPVDLTFVSVDDSADIVKRWKVKHPELAVGDLRIQSAGATGSWLQQLGLDAATAIPLHVFVDPQNRIRCVRSGAIDPGDFDIVKAVLAGQ